MNQEDNEAGQSSSNNNSSTSAAPQSPSETTDAKTGTEPQSTTAIMLGGVAMMMGETRLMMSRHASDVGQTHVTPSPQLYEILRNHESAETSRHVDHASSSELGIIERNNDISSNNTAATESRRFPSRTSTAGSAAPSASITSAHLANAVIRATIAKAAVVAASAVPKQTQSLKIEVTRKQEQGTTEKMSIDKLIPPGRKRTPQMKAGQSQGRWTEEEHQAFLEGLKDCGREWKKVAMHIPTRTSAQIRSHAQKYFAKIQRDHESSMALPAYDQAAAAIPAEMGAASDELTRPPASVQRNVERILANPQYAQREVEHTLSALRERYRQLQQRLERRQQRRSTAGARALFVEDDHHFQSSLSHPRKRRLDDIRENHDDHSTVYSNASASAASLSSAAGRELGNEELIALDVLGGALPLGDSSIDGAAAREGEVNESSAEAKSSDASMASHDDMVLDKGHEERKEV